MDLPRTTEKTNQKWTPENGVNYPDKENPTKPGPEKTEKPGMNDYSKDVNNIDSVISELSEARETFTETPENPYKEGKEGKDQEHKERPFGFPDDIDDDEPMDPEKAKKNGMNMARTVSSLNAWLTSRIGKDKMEKYKCDDEEMEELADVYSELSQTYDMKMPPWISALIVTLFILGPKWADAKEARDKLKEAEKKEALEEQLQEQRELNEALRKQINSDDKTKPNG